MYEDEVVGEKDGIGLLVVWEGYGGEISFYSVDVGQVETYLILPRSAHLEKESNPP